MHSGGYFFNACEVFDQQRAAFPLTQPTQILPDPLTWSYFRLLKNIFEIELEIKLNLNKTSILDEICNL